MISTTVCPNLSDAARSTVDPMADLYGDSADVKDPSPSASSQAEPSLSQQDATATQSSSEEQKPATGGVSSLPAKPSQSSELSYSAQIAQQFSAYKQTPAQERQSKPLVLQSTGGNDSNGSQDGRRPVRPSEMKDEG